jgi:hypothetical protein
LADDAGTKVFAALADNAARTAIPKAFISMQPPTGGAGLARVQRGMAAMA